MMFSLIVINTIAEVNGAGVTWSWQDPDTNKQFNFTLFKERLNFTNARDACNAMGGRLAQPDSQLKNAEIVRGIIQFGGVVPLLGASKDPNGLNQWQYTDGSAVNFTDWRAGKGHLFQYTKNNLFDFMTAVDVNKCLE